MSEHDVTNSDYDEDLFPGGEEEAEEAEAAWGEGEKASRNPIGTFQVHIDEATLGRSQSSDRLQIHYALTIAVGEYKERTIHKYDGLETPQQAGITRQQLTRLGVDTKGMSIKNLPAALVDLQDKYAVITTKQNGEYFNIYVVRLIEAADLKKRPTGRTTKKTPKGKKF